jgi:hypothetical protein
MLSWLTDLKFLPGSEFILLIIFNDVLTKKTLETGPSGVASVSHSAPAQ